ncbi:OLC1v1034208C1 [Oldenlandia corymbosa var. corymbosa]|uniref:OLC1v1034208C1 n=1 Tax=Oldenlandia corymbosa var. corymbosa TaxID=529605 RepID=A0AAV1CQW0_OLDCO|nr:OLC1v1034208C1 [Oldenlandia corymbosa var. corymbosa]
MGNCIILQQKVIKVIKANGETLEYKPPMKVHQILSKFSGHALCDALPVVQHLRPDEDMIGGRVYYLLPPLVAPPKARKKKTVRFATPTPDEAGAEKGEASGVLRIKIVISKQQLQAILEKGTGVTVDDMISKSPSCAKLNDIDNNLRCDHKDRAIGWTPELESIPEGNCVVS